MASFPLKTFPEGNGSRPSLRSVPQLKMAAQHSPIKILHIINDLSIGGAEMMLYKLLSLTNRELFNPSVISLMDSGELRRPIEELRIPVFTADMKPSIATPLSVWRLLRLVRRVNPDLIHGWMYHGSLAAQVSHLICARSAPVLWGIRNSIATLSAEKRVTSLLIKLCAPLSRFPARVVFVSALNKHQHEMIGYSAQNSCVIPNGFDLSLFAPSFEARLAVRAEMGLPANAFLIGLIGRFHPIKDHENFLRAAAILAKEHADVRFVMCGKGVEWSNPFLREVSSELRIDERIFLLGERQDIPRLTAALDIACSSSVTEGFPNVIGEAMACGVACVATDAGGSPLVLGETGRVTPARDPHALASAWEEIIALGPVRRSALGQSARQRIINCFSLESVVNQYEELYKSIVPVSLRD